MLSSSPIKRQFLKENPDLAKFVAANIGGIADILNKDSGLAKIIAGEGGFSDTAILNHIVNKVASQFKNDSPVKRNFLTAHPEAATHLAQNPYELSVIKNDRESAERFVAEIGIRSDTYNSEIFDKAEDLIDLPYLFSSAFLERHKEFARTVVASALNGENIKLTFFLHSNSDLIVDEIPASISTSEMVHAYQVSLVINKLPSDFSLDKNFLSKNKAITTAIVGSEEFLSNIKKAKETLNEFFGAGGTASGLDTKIINTLSRVFQPSASRSNFQTYATIIDIYA